MSTTSGKEELFSEPPAEDAGAQTQARYRYQADCAAPVCLAMVKDDSIEAVICETYEDYVVLRVGTPIELVSVKHRELSRGPWTKPQLFSDGGLGHLFPNWLRSGKKSKCLIQTNGGLKAGNDDAAGLVAKCHAGGPIDDDLLIYAAKQLGAAEQEDVSAFLIAMRFETALPAKEHIASNYLPYAVEVLEHLALPPRCAPQAYEAVAELIMKVSRGTPVLDLTEAVDLDRFRASIARDRVVRSRTIRKDDVVAAIMDACSAKSATLADVPVVETSLTKKLRLGGMEETGVLSAQKLRAAWYTFERRWFADDLAPDFHQLADLRIRVLDMAADATTEAAQLWTDPYANQLRGLMKQHVSVAAIPQGEWLPLENMLIQGLVYQLTDECKIWWSSARLEDAGADG